MRKLPQTIMCYIGLLTLAVSVFWYMPDEWRISPRLEKPTVTVLVPMPLADPMLKYKPDVKVTDKSVCIVGDCVAYVAPWPYLKIAYGGASSEQLIPMICRSHLPIQCRTFIVISGTYLMLAKKYTADRIAEDNQKVVAAIKAKYPSATVLVIPPSDIRDLVKENGHHYKRTYLPSDEGYRVLHERCSQFLRNAKPTSS